MARDIAASSDFPRSGNVTHGPSGYSAWPLGKPDAKHSRPELSQLEDIGISITDPREAVSEFERRIANYAGSRFAVAVDCCSHGLFLCLKYRKVLEQVSIPKRTYVSVPMQVTYATGHVPIGLDLEWSGLYELGSTGILDSAARFTEGMFIGGDYLQVLSFQIKKRLPIGRGGVILTNSSTARDWLKLASYDGRDLTTPYDNPSHVQVMGYHFYMTPEDAARGLLLMQDIHGQYPDTMASSHYPDWTKMPVFARESKLSNSYVLD